MTDVVIRKASLADLKALQEIATRTIKRSYNSVLKDKQINEYLNNQMQIKDIEKNLKYCDLMEISGKIIGFAISIGSVVNLLMVDYAFHRLGYGKKLLKHTENKLKKINTFAYIETLGGNKYALDFYKKHNWSIANTKADENLGINTVQLTKSFS